MNTLDTGQWPIWHCFPSTLRGFDTTFSALFNSPALWKKLLWKLSCQQQQHLVGLTSMNQVIKRLFFLFPDCWCFCCCWKHNQQVCCHSYCGCGEPNGNSRKSIVLLHQLWVWWTSWQQQVVGCVATAIVGVLNLLATAGSVLYCHGNCGCGESPGNSR